MATIDHLLDKVSNPELKIKLQTEIAKLQKDKHFGLVFEDHFPDATLLYDVEVRRGQKVTLKDEPLKKKFEVVDITNGIAECVSLDQHEHREQIEVDTLVSYANLNENGSQYINVDNLLPYADFGDPIYPYLQSIDKISTAPESSLWHEIIEADNYHALQLLAYLYPGKVDCIYIDPPYNTGAKDWKYNNNYVDSNDAYRHSKWLSMMKKRLLLAKRLLNPADSVLIVTIDEKEYVHLGALLEDLFSNARTQMVSCNVNPGGVSRHGEFGRTDEYIYFVKFGESSPTPLHLNDEWLGAVKNTSRNHLHWDTLLRTGTNHMREDRENLFFPILVDVTLKHFIDCGESLPLHESRFNFVAPKNTVAVFPIHKDGSEGCWGVNQEYIRALHKKGYLKIGRPKNGVVPFAYLKSGNQQKVENGIFEIIGHREDGSIIVNDDDYEANYIPGSQWMISAHDATRQGSGLLRKFVVDKRFEFPKSLYAVHDTLRFFVANKPNALIVDFFAGSGTTLHAINLLNAEDGGNRRCIMVTNNEVGEAQETRLKSEGKTPTDKEWIDLGIARYVTWPRTVSSITGTDVKGNPISGEYMTYLTQEKESTRKFKKVAYVKAIDSLSLSDLKELVSNLTDGKIAKNKVSEGTKYIIDEDCDISVLLEDSAASDWLDELDGADHIKTFVIVTQNNKLFNSLKRQITELLGTIKTTEPKTIHMSDGFKTNVEFFHLGFLDKRAVERNRQFKEILPLLWLKAGGIGECPELKEESLPPYIVCPKNEFAVLIDESAFYSFVKELSNNPEIEVAYIITNSATGYKEMVASLNVRTTYQLYRDYLDNFKINYIR